jgi:DeoR family glycerol-3-phosphate regulon repressor
VQASGQASGQAGGQERRLDINARQHAIITLVQARGFATIEDLSEHFAVSSQTIRRDIKELSKRSLLQRYHGGAGLPPGSDRLAYPNRRVRNAEEKRLIAELVARQIPNGAALFMDIGTTLEAVAAALLGHRDLRVVTNHIAVATLLAERTDFEVILSGGMLRSRDRAVTGEAAADFLRRFRVGYGVFSIGAIDDEGQMLDYDYRDVHVSTTAMTIARRRFVVADHSKFNGDAMVAFAPVSEIDAFFTDAPPPAPIARALSDGGVQLFVPDEAARAALRVAASAAGEAAAPQLEAD